MLLTLLTFGFQVIRVAAQLGYGPTEWTASPFNPPSLPLAVKSPYVNTWAPLGLGNNSSPANEAWPRTGNAASSIVGWYVAVRVDGTAYGLLGKSETNWTLATQKSFTFTPTRSLYLLQAGPVNVNMSFLSPVEPDDLVRQSMPFSYMYITTESNDGSDHDVQVYSDISGEWITGDVSRDANWTMNDSNSFVYLQMQLTSPLPYQEDANRPLDATLYHAMNKTDKVAWKIGPSDNLRRGFANGMDLDDSVEAGHHGVGVPYFTTMGFTYDFGTGSDPTEEAVFALGVVRDPVVRYSNREVQIEERSAYYWSNFTNVHDVIEDVLNHFNEAESAARDLDEDLQNVAGQISSDYADLLALSTRQAFGGLEYTLLRSNGEFNTSDVKAFMKDTGGVGSGGVNAVDVMYAAMPAYLYFNPEILGYLLSPLMEYQESTQYTNSYAAQDVGNAFPNATGNPGGHDQKIEETANMLIMSLAHAQASGNGNLLAQHYDLLRDWADYLVNNTISPGDQTTSSSDGVTSSGQAQTNLVLKGIIGIGAMAKIAEYMKRSDDQSRFASNATSYIEQWTDLATASDQLVLYFGGGSSGVMYNLYADKVLQLNLLNSSTYDLQTSFYKGQLSSSTYGIPLDISDASSHARSDWMMFAAASVTDTSVRNSMITQIYGYASANMENKPFPVLYHPNNASQIGGENSPAQGAMFAPLALTVAIQTVSFNETSNDGRGTSGDRLNAGEIAGVVAGGVALLMLVIGGSVFCCRRRREPAPIDIYSLTDEIERVKPATSPSDSVHHPLSSTLYPERFDQQETSSGTFYDKMVVPHAAVVPFHVRNLAGSEFPSTDSENCSSAVLPRNEPLGSSALAGGGSTRDVWSFRKQAKRNKELRSEMDNLRLEIERMRVERISLGMPPPSYNEGQEMARMLRQRNCVG